MDAVIRVQTEAIDLAAEYARLQGNTGIGAIVAFLGCVRDLNLDRGVTTLELEHYPGMTEKSLARIADQAAARWPLQAITVIHRVGPMQPAESIVLVLTASSHRHDAYEANAFIMDYLKTEAPFWKREHTANGAEWVDARESDEVARQRWQVGDA